METKQHFQRQAYYTHGQNKHTKRRFTVCALIKNGMTYIGVAQCSLTDQFSRPHGRTLSLSRAIHFPIHVTENDDIRIALDIMHEFRTEFINAEYFR